MWNYWGITKVLPVQPEQQNLISLSGASMPTPCACRVDKCSRESQTFLFRWRRYAFLLCYTYFQASCILLSSGSANVSAAEGGAQGLGHDRWEGKAKGHGSCCWYLWYFLSNLMILYLLLSTFVVTLINEEEESVIKHTCRTHWWMKESFLAC